MHKLTTERAQSIVQTVAPGHQLVSVTPAHGSFTNDTRILDCRTLAGSDLRLVVKLMVAHPAFASQCAIAEFHALRLARAHCIPAPEPIYLDEIGGVLGTPGVVTRFVEGRQVADPRDPAKWAEELARLLLRIHTIRPGEQDRRYLFDGRDEGLHFLREDWPAKKEGHPLSAPCYTAWRARRHPSPDIAHPRPGAIA